MENFALNNFRLAYPVHTMEGKFLLPAETVLSVEIIDELINSNNTDSYQTHPLLGYGTVNNQILNLIKKPPYNNIFSDQKEIGETLSMMEKIRLSLPVLQTLDYFKKYDYHTYCHSLMVFVLSTIIAKDLIPDYKDWIYETSASPTHDIGKICVPLHILKKTTSLSQNERDMLTHHSVAGYILLSYYHKNPNNLAAIVARDHHERRDGSGKPQGINLMDRTAEIVVACDVYDALVSPRPYRSSSYDNRTALEEITLMAEKNQIGWEVAKALIGLNREKRPKYNETDISLEKRGIQPSNNVYGLTAE